MKWPEQSPNMNPIEIYWKLLNERVHERRPKHLSEIKLFVKEKWANTPIKTCLAHMERYRNRLLALFDNKGCPNRY